MSAQLLLDLDMWELLPLEVERQMTVAAARVLLLPLLLDLDGRWLLLDELQRLLMMMAAMASALMLLFRCRRQRCLT